MILIQKIIFEYFSLTQTQITFPFLDPPGMPQIYGLEKGDTVSSGSSHKLTCSTQAGHPPAKLSWFRGQHMMESHYKVQVIESENKVNVDL